MFTDGWWWTALAWLGFVTVAAFVVAGAWTVWAMFTMVSRHEQNQRDADQLERDTVDPDWWQL